MSDKEIQKKVEGKEPTKAVETTPTDPKLEATKEDSGSLLDKTLKAQTNLEEMEKRIDEKSRILREREDKMASAILDGRASAGQVPPTESEKIEEKAKDIVDSFYG